MKLTYPICCGVDVHKTFLVATVITSDGIIPHYHQKRFSTFYSGLVAFRQWLLDNNCKDVCMESTGKYWVPVWNVLEGDIHVCLANPKWVSAVKGNKDDKKDSKWIGDLFRMGLVPGSYIPVKDIRVLREFTRYRSKLVSMRSSEKNRFQNAFTVCNLTLDAVVSDMFGKSATAIENYLLEADTVDPEQCLSLLRGSLKKNSILSTLSKSLEDDRKQNLKLDILIEVYAEIKMNNTTNQEAIDSFIEWVSEISDCVNSDYWNGEDVMGIFFNEFNRYKKKSESGQVFTPDHITSFMYRLINVNKNDRILDAACGSGAFLVKSMCNMIKESGGVKTKKASDIKKTQLFGIEFDREIFALACANMLIHKDGKTNLEQLDSRTQEACDWIKSKQVTKVLMNPPFESKYGCLTIVENVLKNVPEHTKCAFILPDKKLEKDKKGPKLLKHSTLEKIIKLPEKVFSEGVTTSIFIFEAGVPQNGKDIFTCYIEDDGLETVKNQGRQDIKDRWQTIEDEWVEIIRKQSGSDTIQWIKPAEHLSYQMPEKEFEISDEDFTKTMMDYLMFKEGIDVKEFSEKLLTKVLYNSSVESEENFVSIKLKKRGDCSE